MSASALARRLPATFRSLGTLRVLNVLAVGLALAAVVGSVFGRSFSRRPDLFDKARIPLFDGRLAVATAAATFVFGVVWALLLRSRATMGKGWIQRSWVASVPLAIGNAATTCALLFAMNEGDSVFMGLLVCATFGILCWMPGLVATLLCFGLPKTWSERLAKEGLAGEERGERIVGSLSALVALLTLARVATERGFLDAFTRSGGSPEAIGIATVSLLAVLAAATGSSAAVFAHRRENARRAFVRGVEAGSVEGYRVDPAADGKVLVRTNALGEGYRISAFEEPVFELEETGEAKQSMAATTPGVRPG